MDCLLKVYRTIRRLLAVNAQMEISCSVKNRVESGKLAVISIVKSGYRQTACKTQTGCPLTCCCFPVF